MRAVMTVRIVSFASMHAADHGPDLESVHTLLAEGDLTGAAAAYQRCDPDPDVTRALWARLGNDVGARLLAALPDESKAREVLLWLPPEHAGALLAELDAETGARLIRRLPSDERADLLGELDDEAKASVQSLLPAEAQADAARLLAYEPDTAGGLMETELLSYPHTLLVRDAVADLRANQQKYASIGVQYVYLVDEGRRLVGVAPIRDLMLAPEAAALGSLVARTPATVGDHLSTHDLALAFDEHPYIALPVVDSSGVLLGVVNRADATESEQQQTEDQYRVSQGIVGGEELRSMPVSRRFRRRTAWLGVNLLLCLGGAAVIAAHQETLARAIAIVAVLPVVSATSGNAAMQAAAVSIRELTLGVVTPGTWRRVLVHELSLAILMAVPLGVAVGMLSRLWGADWMVGAAVGLAMALNTVVAIGIGAVCPLLLRRVNVDPALASGPISTTMADVTGFALTLFLVAMAS